MADNYLEKTRDDYELRKARWLAGKKKSLVKANKRQCSIPRPEDEAL